ncbi:hypothetical protein Poli38472_009094 [Pythium oligandrum]|uniref:Ankyrin repeat protein n=1 Tax=Pythium oligandrum TaxID=41045 RepID=A0A8K1CK38_PYTOL|nr:hypothetical protein Poli38472_009094 [Pythium oligandrum]|eukprot:TMW64927.1 hypothetical protein Poli38472_009094 [Pythium oligandrum]
MKSHGSAMTPRLEGVQVYLHAARTGDLHAVEAYLSDSTANVNATLGERWNALHYAVAHGHVHVVERLVQCPSLDLDAVTIMGTSALSLALRHRHNLITSLLLDHGASRATLAREELCQAWDASWIRLDTQRRLSPTWSLVWSPARHHRFPVHERLKCRLLLQANTLAARVDRHHHVVNTESTAWLPRWLRSLLTGQATESSSSTRGVRWRYLPRPLLLHILELALFLW